MRSQIRLKGLRARIISWFFAPTLAILVVVALLTFYAYERVTEDLVIERNQELTRLLSEQLATRLTQHAGLLQGFISGNPELYRYDLAAQQATLRQDIGRLMAFDGGVLMLDDTGTVIAADRYPLNVLGQDWSDRAYVRQMLDAPGLTFSNIEPDGPEGAELIVVAVPATDAEGHFAGVVMGMFRLDTKMSGGYDPILCAQDVPQRFVIPRASIAPDRTTVVVETSFPGHAFKVDVVMVDGEWTARSQ